MSQQAMEQGRFIVFDGIDGSGKGTQAKKLRDYLYGRDKTRHIVATREPSRSKYYAEIRKILKESPDPLSHAKKLTDLFVKDRKVHTAIIAFLLEHGFDVICDRYKYSTLAYQQTQGISLSKLLAMHKGILVPDLVMIIDIPVKIALARIAKDAGREYKEMFEEEQFQKKVRQNFLRLPSQLPGERIVVINGNRPVASVFKSIRREVDKIL